MGISFGSAAVDPEDLDRRNDVNADAWYKLKCKKMIRWVSDVKNVLVVFLHI